MPGEVPGDGVVSVTLIEEESKMAETVDLPANVAQQLLTDNVQRHSRQMEETLGNVNNVNNLARLAGFRKFDEVGTIEGRANSGVNATPIAGPTTPAPAPVTPAGS
jgi:hypothetical protein